MRILGFDQMRSIWHRAPSARSPQGQNSLWDVLGNPSFSATVQNEALRALVLSTLHRRRDYKKKIVDLRLVSCHSLTPHIGAKLAVQTDPRLPLPKSDRIALPKH